ncbi:MAG TPA: alpha/beta hydrolase [Steroidobacteraceae bacterium]|nr:alpha/beta hydrolase [Steroidobacteraceae bacterium]
MFYTIRGAGDPLILIHGGLGSSDMFVRIAPKLSAHRQIIAVDLQGHGRTADIDRPLSFQAMADDIEALLEHLRLREADVLGYSVGGEVALRMAIAHPKSVRRLIVISAAFKRDGWYPEILAQMEGLDEKAAEQLKQTDLYRTYRSIAPRPEEWASLCSKLGVMFRQDYDWTGEVAHIKAPTLLIFGDSDAVRIRHAEEFFELLGGGRKDGGWDGSGVPRAHLAVLPGQTHYSILDSPLLATVVDEFLGAPARAP